jgi:hypothetical protein
MKYYPCSKGICTTIELNRTLGNSVILKQTSDIYQGDYKPK